VLTAAIAQKLEMLWALEGTNMLSDEQIAIQCGIKPCTLRTWVHRNKKVEFPDDKGSPPKVLGLKDIRTRARANLKILYLTMLHKLMKMAEASGDLRTASEICKWLLEKQFPEQFGRRPVEETENDAPRLIRIQFSNSPRQH